jgi:type I restriction enzyme R subunit
LAKTIIFARSHKHAMFIKERFDKQYPQYKGEFLKVIDYHEEYRYDLLNRFKVKNGMPQIAVSVDMLDTGIDIPEVCNLVFFKPVRSSAKFWQMVGRGTRLCPDLFGFTEDKVEFVIFDLCENLEFFAANPKGFEGTNQKTLSQRLFELRLRLAFALLSQEEKELKDYGQSIIDFLIRQTQELNMESFVVRQHWKEVEKYRDPAAWNSLTDLDIKELFDHIAPLMTEAGEDEFAKRFDVMMLDLQLSVLNGERKQAGIIEKVIGISGRLSKKASIPAVAQRMETIELARDKAFWAQGSIPGIERIRIELREIIKFLDIEQQPIYFTSFTDEFDGDATEHELVYNINNLDAYRRKVEQYLKEQQHHITISKLRTNKPITKDELSELERMMFEQGTLGTKDDFIKAYGEQPLGKFIRSILGLDINAAKVAFAGLLSSQNLNSQQIRLLLDRVKSVFHGSVFVSLKLNFHYVFQ